MDDENLTPYNFAARTARLARTLQTLRESPSISAKYLEDIEKKAGRTILLKQQVAKVGMWIEDALGQKREVHAIKHRLGAVPLCEPTMDSTEIWADLQNFS